MGLAPANTLVELVLCNITGGGLGYLAYSLNFKSPIVICFCDQLGGGEIGSRDVVPI